MDKATWEARRSCVGGSDAPAVMNLSRFGRTPMSVWADKVGLTKFEEQEQTLRQWVGLRLEPLIAEMAGARLDRKFVRRHGLIVSKTHPWMGGNVDYVGLECKTSRGSEGWGPDGSVIATMDDIGAVPIDYLIQCLHYLFVTGWKQMTLAVLIGHDDFRTYEVHPVPELTEGMVEAEREFWHEYVVPGVPPPLDDSEATREWLRQRYPRASGSLRPATPEELELLDLILDAQANEKRWNKEGETLKARLKAAIGEDLGMKGPGVVATWSSIDRQPVTDWASVAKAYRALVAAPDAQLDVIVGLHTSQPESYRRLTVSRKSEVNA